MKLPYTICFCCCREHVLMLYRRKAPNKARWNGLGGKIEVGETPFSAIRREVFEEASITLLPEHRLRFTGTVTWPVGADSTSASSGMYVFLADLPATYPLWEKDHDTPEGLLSWKPVEWVCNPESPGVVGNIHYFLPEMLSQQEPHEYFCDYRGKYLAQVIRRSLSRREWPQNETDT